MLRDVKQKQQRIALTALSVFGLAVLAVGVLGATAALVWLMLVALGMPPWTWSPD